MRRLLMVVTTAALLGCGSASAQIGGLPTSPGPSPLGMTSPLGIGPAAPVAPTGSRWAPPSSHRRGRAR